jgi:L-threonylcarbamoyladenylate synthase
LALELLQLFASGIAAPSANRFGRLSPTSADHVRADLGPAVEGVIEGQCEVGIESTIVDCSGEAPVVLRPGKITAAEIEAIAGLELADPGEASAKAPGTLPVHYAPRAKLRLLRRTEFIEALSTSKGKRLAALLLEIPVPRLPAAQVIVLPAVAASYARNLYANLRVLDATNADVILVESPPESPAWAGVLDRLRRAARA